MARGLLLSIAVCLALVGCGGGQETHPRAIFRASGPKGTVQVYKSPGVSTTKHQRGKPRTCAQLRRQMEATEGKGGDFECTVNDHKAKGSYSTGELTFPHGRGKHRQGEFSGKFFGE
jgi:hypothetical protein